VGQDQHDAHLRPQRARRATGRAGSLRTLGDDDVLGSDALDGLRRAAVRGGAINGGVFRAWVEQHLVKSLREGDIVVMDNLSSHKTAGEVTAIKAAGARVRYLPPYSRRRGADHRKTLDALRPRPRLVHRTRVPKLPPPLWVPL
jgi:hypothetical protein